MGTKDRVLEQLGKADGFLSGEAISGELGISRSAVWKAINALREMGYEIDSVTNRGYRLVRVPDILTEESIRSFLQGSLISEVHALKTVDSTNNEAKRWAHQGAPHGSLFVADEQTGGKGRLGRVWKSPAGSGLWFSVLLRPKAAPEQVTGLTLTAGLSVAKAIQKLTGCKAQIKWPNDVVIGSQKVCGILTEMAAEMESVEYVIPGIGINVNTESFPEEIAYKATSLFLSTGKKWSRAQLLGAVLSEMEALLCRQEQAGAEAILEEYRKNCVSIGRQVSTQRGNIQLSGIAEDVTESGELVVRQANGTRILINSGEVSVQGIYTGGDTPAGNSRAGFSV